MAPLSQQKEALADPQSQHSLTSHIRSPTIGLDTEKQTELLTFFEKRSLALPKDLINVVSGATAGFASGVATCPLDVIKTKLQAQGGFRAMNKSAIPAGTEYRGMVGTAKIIWREEGLRGMYRGLGPIILGYLPTWAVYFTVYEKSKIVLGAKFGELCRTLAPENGRLIPRMSANFQ
jgi:Mitochondrial carrier protein